jgi:hypothetical protein
LRKCQNNHYQGFKSDRIDEKTLFMSNPNNNPEKQSSPQTSWHLSFAEALQWDLSPVDISVTPEARVMTQPPRVDILLLKRNQPNWTTAQLERVPDGIRQSQASHLLLEFKYSQSLDQKAMAQAIGYDHFYQESNHLDSTDVQTFLVSAKKPQLETRQLFGYQKMRYPGVYESQRILEKRIGLISLNELTDEPYNAVFKLFATHQIERAKALNTLEHSRAVSKMPQELKSLFYGLQLFDGDKDMNIELTPEQVKKAGQLFGKSYLESLSPEELLAGINPRDVMSHFKPADRLAGINPREVINHFKPADMLTALRQMERLEGLSIEEIEAFENELSELKKRRK